MDDRDLENLLRAYCPAAPSPGLRDRIIAAARPPARTWPWAAAAAALFIVTLLSSAGSGRAYRQLAPAPSAPATVEGSGLQPALAGIYGDRSATLLLAAMAAHPDEDVAPASDAELIPR